MTENDTAVRLRRSLLKTGLHKPPLHMSGAVLQRVNGRLNRTGPLVRKLLPAAFFTPEALPALEGGLHPP